MLYMIIKHKNVKLEIVKKNSVKSITTNKKDAEYISEITKPNNETIMPKSATIPRKSPVNKVNNVVSLIIKMN